MSYRPILLTALVIATLAVLSGSVHTADNPNEVAAIRRVLDQQVVDWNKKDLDAFLLGYWNSPKVVFQSGSNRFTGYEAMRDRYRKTYQADGKEMGKLAFSEVEVELLSADAALVRGRFQLTMSDGKMPSGIYTLIMRKLPRRLADRS